MMFCLDCFDLALAGTAANRDGSGHPRNMKPVQLRRGNALFLVGPSSAGKTSLGRELLEVLPELYVMFEADRLGLRLPQKRASSSPTGARKRLREGRRWPYGDTSTRA